MLQHNHTLKILAIGNSFSQDALEHLYNIAESAGFKQIVLANLYIGGCSLETHWNNAKHNLAAYSYDKNATGTWQSLENQTILHGLQDEVWDIITMQQVSGLSGIASTYDEENRLSNLINYIHHHNTNPNLKLGWHMTWAYDEDCSKEAFAHYDNNQLTMYNAILDATKWKIVNNQVFDFIIPTGTVIQNLRTSALKDFLTRDGFHLSLGLGRYVAGLTWFTTVTDLSPELVTYVPSQEEITPQSLELIKAAVTQGVQHPFVCTNIIE